MPLPSGARLGAYEVLDLIGIGGMGEVYRTRDLRLQRDVALKILPSVVAADPDRLARFKREAQVLASLNHPNIAAIYGLEDSDGAQALILELVDGPTLADRIEAGPIPLDEALPIATQIASALEAAHERGIIHRDLKPANIKVRPDGAVKVLDFGLAKALANDASAPEAAGLPTITSPALTRLGVILGTAAYMSPEQARGKEADKRSDIWAFGCVLYELLSGKRPFEGSEVTDTLAGVLKSDPDWSALPARTPHGIRRVLRRCLEKDPQRRLHDIADARLDLEELATQDAGATLPAARSKDRLRDRVAWALAAVSLALLSCLAAYVALKPTPAREVTRFLVHPPPDTVLGTAAGRQLARGAGNFAVSPDGTRLAFVSTGRTGRSQLWIRAFDSFDAVPLAGTEDASFPFWSPDARRIGFFAATQLKRIDAAGGLPRKICDLTEDLYHGATWGSRGDVLFSAGSTPRLYRVSEEGGTPVPLSVGDARWPRFLPDGRTFLYLSKDPREGWWVYASAVAGGAAPKRVLTSLGNADYDSSGFLLFTSTTRELLRQPFDVTRLELSGEATAVADDVAITPAALSAFSVSANGVLAFQPQADASSRFAWFDRSGRMLEPIGEPGKYRHPTLSPDGRRLLYANVADGDLWVLDMNRQIPSKFTNGAGGALAPVWSPDGAWVYFRKQKGSRVAFYKKSASGSAAEELFFEGSINGPQQVSPDGKWLLYFAYPEGQALHDIYVLPTTGERKPEQITRTPYGEVEPQFSPDGKFLAYSANETGRNEIYVQPFPATGERWGPISNAGGRQPLWRPPDGKELYFVSDDRKFYAVEIKQGPKFDYGPPQFLFEMPANVTATRNSYIPTADGKRFLINMALDLNSPPIHVVRNWTAERKH
jgi:Tol biopolymer transport system component